MFRYTPVVSAMFAALFLTQEAQADDTITVSGTQEEMSAVINSIVPNSALVTSYDIGEWLIKHTTSYLPRHPKSDMSYNKGIRFQVAKSQTIDGCGLSGASITKPVEDSTPILMYICVDDDKVEVTFSKELYGSQS